MFKSLFHKKKLTMLLVLSSLVSIATELPASETNSYALCLKSEANYQYQNAIAYCQSAAENGTKEAAFALGRIYRDYLYDRETSLQWFLSAANQGDALAQYEIGLIYLSGQIASTPADPAEAKKWFMTSVSRDGSGASAYELYKLSSSPKEALLWLQKAVNAGLPVAARNLATAYAQGLLGLSVDMTKSQELLNQADQFAQ